MKMIINQIYMLNLELSKIIIICGFFAKNPHVAKKLLFSKTHITKIGQKCQKLDCFECGN